jgi:hypothetical protein
MQLVKIRKTSRLVNLFLLLVFVSPMAHAASSWSPASFSIAETWNDYLTNDLNSSTDSSTLSTSGGNDRSMGLYLTGGVTNVGGQYLLTHSGGDTLAMSSLLFSWGSGSFDFPTDGSPWTGRIIPDNGNPSTNAISVSFTISQSEAAGKAAGDYITTINVCGKRNGNNANCNGNQATLATLNITVTIPVINAAIIAFPIASGTGGSDLSVTWDGASTVGTFTDSINICVGTDSSSGVDVVVTSANSFQVTDGTTPVPYTLTLDGDDVTDGSSFVSAVDATDLLCTVSDIPLEIGFSNATLATTPTDGVTPFLDQVTITVTPQ